MPPFQLLEVSRDLQTIEAPINVALCCPWELDAEILLLKMPQLPITVYMEKLSWY